MRISIVLGRALLVCAAACGKVETAPPVDAASDPVDAAPASSDAAVATLAIDPATVDFGGVAVGASRTISAIVITNPSAVNQPMFTPRLEGADAAAFAITQSTCTRALAPGEHCDLALVATPARIGVLEAALVVGTESPTRAALTVTGLQAGGLEIAPGAHAFGRVGLGVAADLPFAITNHGAAALPAPTGTIAGEPDFTVSASTCTVPLQPGDACTITASFRPTQLGTRTGSLIVTAGSSGVAADLDGEGGATLVVTRTGSGDGTVTGGSIQCGSTCAQEATTASVTLTATAAMGSDFGGWAGRAAACGGAPTCAVAIDVASVDVEARFVDRPNLNLIVANPVDTAGSVRVSDPIDQCTDACTYEYGGPTTITLSAQAGLATCGRFVRWDGGCSGTTSTCTVTVTADTTVTAVFSHVAGCTPS